MDAIFSLISKYSGQLAIIVGSLLTLYFAGKRSAKNKQLKKDKKALEEANQKVTESLKRQSKRTKNHDKRLEKIRSGDVSADDASRMLSTYPPENEATRAAQSE